MSPKEILSWAKEVRAGSNGAFQLNTWIPDPVPARDAAHEARVRAFLSQWGPEVPWDAGDASPLDFDSQCEAMLEAGPSIMSSIMGVYPPAFVARLKERRIAWFATVTTVAEARIAEETGADVIVAQGAEATGRKNSAAFVFLPCLRWKCRARHALARRFSSGFQTFLSFSCGSGGSSAEIASSKRISPPRSTIPMIPDLSTTLPSASRVARTATIPGLNASI
jgi:hypothetical protein